MLVIRVYAFTMCKTKGLLGGDLNSRHDYIYPEAGESLVAAV